MLAIAPPHVENDADDSKDDNSSDDRSDNRPNSRSVTSRAGTGNFDANRACGDCSCGGWLYEVNCG